MKLSTCIRCKAFFPVSEFVGNYCHTCASTVLEVLHCEHREIRMATDTSFPPPDGWPAACAKCGGKFFFDKQRAQFVFDLRLNVEQKA